MNDDLNNALNVLKKITERQPQTAKVKDSVINFVQDMALGEIKGNHKVMRAVKELEDYLDDAMEVTNFIKMQAKLFEPLAQATQNTRLKVVISEIMPTLAVAKLLQELDQLRTKEKLGEYK